MKKIICAVILLLFFQPGAFAGFFSMNNTMSGNSQSAETKTDVIPIFDSLDRLIQRRIEEANKLIEEGRKLIKKGERRNNQSLITKGRIKKEIGEKQLQLLNKQTGDKKEQDKKDEW